MYPDEMSAVDEAFTYLAHITISPAQSQTGLLTATHVEAIIQILDRWPSSQRFPGESIFIALSAPLPTFPCPVIDLSRLLTGFCPDVLETPGLKLQFFEALFKASEWSASWTAPLPKARETNILLLFRTLANTFQEGTTIGEGTWAGQVIHKS